LNNGLIGFRGGLDESINYYLESNKEHQNRSFSFERANHVDSVVFLYKAYVCNESGIKKASYEINESIFIRLNIVCNELVPGLYGYITISDNNEICLIESDTTDFGLNDLSCLKIGENLFSLRINPHVLPHGEKFIYINLTSNQSNNFNVDSPGHILKFHITDNITTRNVRRSAMTSQILKWEPINE
jgi:hypothetical protein